MKNLLLSTAFILAASASFALNDNTGSVSGNSNQLLQATDHSTINSGAGAGATSNTAQGGAGGAGGSATARSGDSTSMVIGSGNGTGIGGGATVDAKTGDQNVSVGGTSITYPKQRLQAPPVFAPGLVGGFDCNGSTTLGTSFAGVGIGGGTTHANEDCVNVYLYRVLKAEGDSEGAWGVLCESPKVRKHSPHCRDIDADDLIGLPVVEAPTNGSRNR